MCGADRRITPSPVVDGNHSLVNILSIALTHALMLVAAWRLLFRDDLAADPPPPPDEPEDEGESPFEEPDPAPQFGAYR